MDVRISSTFKHKRAFDCSAQVQGLEVLHIRMEWCTSGSGGVIAKQAKALLGNIRKRLRTLVYIGNDLSPVLWLDKSCTKLFVPICNLMGFKNMDFTCYA